MSLGSEYLFAVLGLDVIGIFSITSAQLLRELPLGTEASNSVPSSILQLSVFTLTSLYGMDTAESALQAPEGMQGKRWKVLIVAVLGDPARKLLLFQVCHPHETGD